MKVIDQATGEDLEAKQKTEAEQAKAEQHEQRQEAAGGE
jgi:hypothetical protein